MKEKYIYILLSHTGSVVSTMIRKFSEMEYSHISIGIDDSLSTFYSFGRRMPSNPLIAGFVMDSIKDGVYTRFSNAKFALYRLKITDDQYKKIIYELRHFEENRLAYKYNFIGLLSAKAGYSLDRKKAYFCSQFASKLLESADVYDFNKKHGLISPMDFLEIPNVEIINKGILRDFRKYQWDIVEPKRNIRVINLSKKVIKKLIGV